MRRKEKQVTSLSEIETIIRKAKVCRLGINDETAPYIVPLSFGYSNQCLYFHSAIKGKKTTLLQKNPNACFELESNCAPIEAEEACKWGMQFKSVIGTGVVEFITDPDEKIKALDIIMAQYSDHPYEYSSANLKVTQVFKLKIDEMTGKQSGF